MEKRVGCEQYLFVQQDIDQGISSNIEEVAVMNFE
jgi:hypothetical protein